MLKRLMAALLFSQLALFIGCGGCAGSRPTIEESSKEPEMRSAPTGETSMLSSPSDGLAPGEGSLVFEIVEQNRVKKGGSLDPLLVPECVLFVVKAVLREAPKK